VEIFVYCVYGYWKLKIFSISIADSKIILKIPVSAMPLNRVVEKNCRERNIQTKEK